jgi:hypothetical protein
MKREEPYTIDNNRMDKLINNMYIPVNYTPPLEASNAVLETLKNSFTAVEELNERIKATDDDISKSSLRQQKSAICKQMIEYSGKRHNESHDQGFRDKCMEYRVYFGDKLEGDSDLIEKYYGHFQNRNPDTFVLENDMLVEIRSLYKDSFKETVRQKLAEKNVGSVSIHYAWQGHMLTNYNNYEQNCINHERQIEKLQEMILNCGATPRWGATTQSFTDAKPLENKLNQYHASGIERLTIDLNQLIGQFIDKGIMHQSYLDFRKLCEQSGEPLEESEALLEIKDLQEKLTEKIAQTLDNHDFDEQTKSQAFQLFNSQYKQHLNKLQNIEKSIKPINDGLLACGNSQNSVPNFDKFESLTKSLNQQKREIKNWKNKSDSLSEEIIKTVITFAQEKMSIILELKSIGENLEEKINKTLDDKIKDENIKEEVKNQVWQMPIYSRIYEKFFDKLETHKQLVKTHEDKILNSDTLSKTNSLNTELKKIHNDATDELNFHTNQVIKHFVTKALQLAGQQSEQSSTMADINNLYDEFNENANKNWTENNISQKIKSAVDKLFRSKCDDHLKKLKNVAEEVQKLETELLLCDNFKESKKIVASLNEKQKAIDNWKQGSDKLIEEITKKIIEFSSTMPAIVNPIENHQPNSLVPVDSVAISEIQSLLSKFPEKLNGSLSKENLSQKIKSDVCKITRSKCDQHLEQLKLIEKSIKKYEALPISDEVINHLAQRYDQIEKWKHNSDNLIEQITNKAIEMSYQTGQVQSVSNQQLLDKIAQLEEKLAQQQHPSFEALSSIAHPHSEPYSEPSLEEYNQEAQSLLEQNVEGDDEFNEKKDKIIKEIMDKLLDHPSLQQVQELKQELDYIRSVLKENQDEEANESLASSIEGYDAELKDYYDGFVNEFNNAFTSSQAVFGGGIKLDATKPIGESIATSIAEYGSRLIPIVGDAIATGIKTGSTYKAERKLKENCNNLNKFGVSTTRLEKIAKYLAKKVIDNDDAKPTIKGYVPPATGNVKKFLDKINIKDEDSNQEKLGHIHAQKVLKEYIYNGKFKTLPLDSGNPVKKLLLDWMTDEFKKDDINEQAENNLPNLIDEAIVQAEEELANASLLPEGQGVIGGQMQSIQQPMGQLQSVVVESDEEDLTPRTMRKMIKELKTKNNQLQDEKSAKDIIIQEKDGVIQEKNNRIEQLETNPLVDIDKWVLKTDVESIIAEGEIELNDTKNLLNNKNEIIQQIIEESSAKDVLLEDQKKIAYDQKIIITDQQKVIEKKDIEIEISNKEKLKQAKEIANLHQDKDDLRDHRDHLKVQVKEQKELTQKITEEKDVKISDLQKLIDELRQDVSYTMIQHIDDSSVDESQLQHHEVQMSGQIPTHEIVIE